MGLATQDAWSDFFARLAKNKKYISKPNETFISKVGGKTRAILENLYENSLALVKAFFKSFKQMWNGKPNSSGISKHAGKSFISVAAGATVLLTTNTILRATNLAKNKNINTIDNRIASEEI